MPDGILTIEPKSALAVQVPRGAGLRVIDLEGSQVADLVAFNAANPAERFSQGFTRLNNDKAGVVVGDQLFSSLNTAMMTVRADTVGGVHDLLFPPCSTFLYEHVFGVRGKTGCREHLTGALAPYGIGFDLVTDPFNVFMNTAIDEQGRMAIYPPTSGPGDYFEIRAELDLIIAVSACAAEVNACNGPACTSIGLQVL